MVIGFCGRQRSGKSELAKICEEKGYTKLYFAMPLKQLCASILNVSVDELNDLKNNGTQINLTLNDDICKLLSERTDIDIDSVKDECLGKVIGNVRELLQFIGTDLIRKHNNDWHVNQIRSMMSEDVDYVIDDVRFQNEKKMIDEMGGDCWFITRTTFENVSNHTSETSISWKHCWNKIIINDNTLANLIFKWEIFMDNYKRSCQIREGEFNKILEGEVSKNDITPLSVFDMLFLSKAMFSYVPREYEKGEIDTLSMNEDKSVIIKYKDGTFEIVDNPLSIEELKKLI